jgi:hypothetical protein
VATWSPADIDKFEFLLTNFGGRIRRENSVRSAQVECYKKYKQWLGDGHPPNDDLGRPDQMADLRTLSLQPDGKIVEERIETLTETKGEVSIDKASDPAGDLHRGRAIEQLEQ